MISYEENDINLVKKYIDFWLQIGYNVSTINFGKEVFIMKLRKIFAGMSALAIAATMAISASAETGDTFLMMADGNWTYSNMNDDDNGFPLPTGGKTVQVTEDGTYTVDINLEDTVAWANKVDAVKNPDTHKDAVVGDPAFGLTVLNVDIEGLATKLGVGTDSDAWSEWCEANGVKEKKATIKDKMAFAKTSGLDVTSLKIVADGETVYEYAPEEILFADVEANGKIRIEIFNQYGDSKDLAPQAIKDAAGELEFENLSAEFTITGVNGKEEEKPAETEKTDEEKPAETEKPAEETPAPTDGGNAPAQDTTPAATGNGGAAANTTTTNGNTGASAGLALAGLALAGAAIVATKKR